MKDESTPVKWVSRLLRIACPDDLFEEIEGDLIQQYRKDVSAFGEKRARRIFMWAGLRFFRPGILWRNKLTLELNLIDMVLYNLKFGVRVFLKDKFFSTLNVLGLGLGIAIGILLLLVLQKDLTYDQHYTNYKRIYRVGAHQQQTGLELRWARSAWDLGGVLKTELPEVEHVVRVDTWDRALITYDNKDNRKTFYVNHVVEADTNYFQVFNADFISGSPGSCLHGSHDLVLTASIAAKFFGASDPMGQSLLVDGTPWNVAGVIKDLPENTHLKFDILLSNSRWFRETKQEVIQSENFWNPGSYLYVQFPEGYNPQDFYTKFGGIYDKYFKPFAPQVEGQYEPILEPLAAIHFHSTLDNDEPHGNFSYVIGFVSVGALIILLACINYMNLSTAKSVTRATEMAVKKCVGSSRRALMASFLTESLLLAFVSLVLALSLLWALFNLTSFNSLIGKQLTLDFIGNPGLLWGSLGIAAAIGLLSGIYPSLYLPSLPTLNVLKGTFKNERSSHWFRKILITAQFSISIFVVVCTLFMRRQIEFVSNAALGFNKENVLVLPVEDTTAIRQMAAIKNELLLNPHIKSITTSQNVMGVNLDGVHNFWAETTDGRKQIGFAMLSAGDDYIKTIGMQIVQGSDFRPGPSPDSETQYMVNETAARLLGGGPEVIGRKIETFHGDIPGHVVAVVKDFHFKSLRNRVEPLLIRKTNREHHYVQFRLEGKDMASTIAYLQDKWKGYAPAQPFEYFFLDKRFNEQYKSDEIQGKLLLLLSGICIFISLLGLVGLSAFTTTQRTKEIGVRKVLGANIRDIIVLLSKNTLGLVVLSSILVIPVSWWVINAWVSTFVTRIPFSFALYLLVVLVALIVVFLTILFQSLKTVRSNPVDAMRYE